MTVAKPIHRLTEVEYLDLERSLESKNEFFDGEVVARSGGTPLHSQIAAKLIQVIGRRLSNGKWVVYTSDLRLKVEGTGLLWRSCPIEAHNPNPMS